MFLTDVLNELQTNTLPNITRDKQTKNENLIVTINEGIKTLHNIFHISSEQAIVLVPAFRNIFKISKEDPNVIMASYYKIAECALKSGFESKSDMVAKLVEYDKNLKRDILLKNEDNSTEIFSIKGTEVLQLLGVEDTKGTNYSFNAENVFTIDPITLHFPNTKEGDILYVEYKPKPTLANIGKLYEHIDLPDSLIECLYSFVALKIISGIEGYKQFYPNLLNTYNNEINKAMTNGAVMPEGLVANLVKNKGFI
ncbi:hypothetical protein CFT13S00388_02560 [Campylobacter fetus subsp. testudinum]|uniref:hypothetical protein n=1 Tax=Campylobacter fetus TaxID=196 RepID=UPI000818A8E8|nr:hypothetical protein [Campylobacter fetus]OCR88068.1 hypothetical protein CFT13S00388_02560 [Campylobacter fetus subsp. testudinum]